MLKLIVQCGGCNNINRNTALRQDKMLIKSVILAEFSRSHRSLLSKVSQILSIFASIYETVSSPPTKIQ